LLIPRDLLRSAHQFSTNAGRACSIGAAPGRRAALLDLILHWPAKALVNCGSNGRPIASHIGAIAPVPSTRIWSVISVAEDPWAAPIGAAALHRIALQL
jgi:hypothetical protein